MPYWFNFIRAVLELLYFAAGVVIAVAAVWGLNQLKLTRQIFRTNAKRESLKFAAERCQYFAEVAVPAYSKMVAEYKRLNLKFLTTPFKWAIQNGEIVNHNFDLQMLKADVTALDTSLVRYLNALEAFAIPFVAGVADDDLGFQETAMSFCAGVKMCMPAFFQMRIAGAARYESTIKLYDMWNKRLVAKAFEPAKKSIGELTKQMDELAKSVEKEKIKPIGGDI